MIVAYASFVVLAVLRGLGEFCGELHIGTVKTLHWTPQSCLDLLTRAQSCSSETIRVVEILDDGLLQGLTLASLMIIGFTFLSGFQLKSQNLTRRPLCYLTSASGTLWQSPM